LLCEAHKTQPSVRTSCVCRDRSGRGRGEVDRGERKTSREEAGSEKIFLESFFGALDREKGFLFGFWCRIAGFFFICNGNGCGHDGNGRIVGALASAIAGSLFN
jgi:hypothetical protein